MNTESPSPSIPGMEIPQVNADAHRRQLKITLFSAQKTAALAVWLVAVPCFFLFAVTMKHYFHYDLGLFTIIEESIASIDRSSGFPMSVLVLVGLPLVALALNVLSIMHVRVDSPPRELIITISLRWKNILFSCISLGLISIFFLYALVENIHHSFRGSGL